MLKIQEFLRSGNQETALERASEKFNLKIYEEDPELVALNYSMIDSERGVREVEECRGLILERKTWNIIAFPFQRFYNLHEEPYVDKIDDYSKSVLWEKRDGTLCTLYYYDGWKVATRSRPMADGGIDDTNTTFAQLFWATIEENYGKNWEQNLSKNLNLVFELTGPKNRIVTPYELADLRLLTAREIDRETDKHNEYSLESLKELSEQIKIPLPKFYKLDDLDFIQDNEMKKLSTLEEGFVLTDYSEYKNGSCHRIKIKNPRYLAASKMIGGGFDEHKALVLILCDGDSEFISYFPEYEKLIIRTKVYLGEYCNRIKENLDYLNNIIKNVEESEKPKTFALAVQNDSKINKLDSGILFRLRKSPKSSPMDVILGYSNSQIKSLNDRIFS